MLELIIPMKINSEKKHSVRYDAIEPNSAVSSIYLARTAIGNVIPQTVTLTVKVD